MGAPKIVAVPRLQRSQQRQDLVREVGLAHGQRLLEGSRLAQQHRQVVPEVGDRLARSRPARVSGDAAARGPDLDVIVEGTQPEPLAGVLDRHRIAAPLEADQGAVVAGFDRMPGAGQEGMAGQRSQQRSLLSRAII